jgi:putative two-component system response regulator
MRILLAEDNSFYRRALEMTLREWGYDVVSVADGISAWNILQEENAPKLAILDWMMPGLEGPQVCRRLRAAFRHEPTYVIILTAKDGTENAVAALESGADDFVMKPFDRDELNARLRVGRRIVGLQTSQTIVYSFARAVDGKSPYTQGHSERVTRYALALAEHLGLSGAERDVIRRGATVHDLGKICIPDAILNKPGPLTKEEYDIVKMHPAQGAQMVEPLESVRELVPIIRWHHERIDGRGYPDGLTGDKIPLLVRIVSVADVYDAVRSDRPYRLGLEHDECLRILQKDAAGGGLDPELVERFCEIGLDGPLAHCEDSYQSKVLDLVGQSA